MSRRGESFVMKHRRIVLVASVALFAAALGPACDAKDPCGEGLYELPSYRCGDIPAVPEGGAAETSTAEAAAGDAGDGEGGEGGEAGEAAAPPAPTNFGKPCAAMAECGGDAPICAAPQLPYCTQKDCKAGEANAGVCPAGFTCIKVPGYPSGCMKD